MIYLAFHSNPRIAQAFIDYMATKKIEVILTPQESGVDLYLITDTDLSDVQLEWQKFIENPYDKKYAEASWQVADSRTQSFKYPSVSFLKLITKQAGVMTLSVMVICLLVYIVMNLGLEMNVFLMLHFPENQTQYWQIWRWISHTIMHFSIIHITFNLLWWWQLGGQIERILGKFKLAQLFIFSGILSGAIQFWDSGINFGGLSGVIYALLAYIWIVFLRHPHKGLVIEKNIVIFMLAWLVIGFIQPFLNIANMAHLGGLVAGIILGFFDTRSKYIDPDNQERWTP